MSTFKDWVKQTLIILFLLIAGIAFAWALTGCNSISCEMDPDCYYASDPVYATSQKVAINNAREQTKLSPDVFPTQEKIDDFVLTTNSVECTLVTEGDGVMSVVEKLNNGFLASSSFMDIYILIKHNSEKNIMKLDEAIATSPVIFIGDELCISPNKEMLKSR